MYAGCAFVYGNLLEHRDEADRARVDAWLAGTDPERAAVRIPSNQEALRQAVYASGGEIG
jgi:hypothetical protein